MGDNILKLTTAIDLKGMEKGFDAIKKGTMSTAKAVNKILNTISGTIKKLVSIYLLKNVFDKLKNYLDSSMRKNREFAASMKNLRGSMAAAFQPIYETIAPGLIYLVQVLNYAVQAVGRFIAAISGKSYAQMLKNAQALSKQKDALDGVGGAAADAQRQLMGFDEINKLSDSGSGTGMTFNELDLGSLGGAIDDFAKRLRDLILSGQFQQAGELVAGMANQIISSLDLEQIASKTAGWINNLTEFANALGYGINWDELGKKFADGVSTFLGTLNGFDLGKTIALKFAIAIKVVAGFIKNLKWQTVGQTLGDALLGFAQGLGSTISENLDTEFWETLNTNIEEGFAAFSPKFCEALKVAIDTIIEQAPEVIGTIGTIGEEIVKMFSEALSVMNEEVVIGKLDQFDDKGFQLNKMGTRWEKLGHSIAEGIQKIDWATILKEGAKGLGNFAIGMADMLATAINDIDWSEIGKAIVEGIASINWSGVIESAGNLILAIGNGLIELILGCIDAVLGTDMSGTYREWVEDTASRIANDLRGTGETVTLQSQDGKQVEGVASDDFQRIADARGAAVQTAEDGARYIEGTGNIIYKELTGTNEKIIEAIQLWEESDFDAFNEKVKELIDNGLTLEQLQQGFDSYYGAYVEIGREHPNAKIILEDIETSFGELTTATSGATEEVSGLGTQVESTTSTAGSQIAGFSQNAVNNLDSVTDATYRLHAAMGWLGGVQIGPMGNSIRSGSNPFYSPFYENLFHGADGAVIPPNREFLAVFGDQRSGNNIETPEALMRQIVREESGAAGGDRLEELLMDLISVVSGIRIGDETIGRAAARYNRQHGRATGG